MTRSTLIGVLSSLIGTLDVGRRMGVLWKYYYYENMPINLLVTSVLIDVLELSSIAMVVGGILLVIGFFKYSIMMVIFGCGAVINVFRCIAGMWFLVSYQNRYTGWPAGLPKASVYGLASEALITGALAAVAIFCMLTCYRINAAAKERPRGIDSRASGAQCT